MPRFSWSNHEKALLERLAADLSLKGDAAEALEQQYGVKPKADFIKDAWPTLLDAWFPNDDDACRGLGIMLREKGLGNIDIKSPLAYLKSCRNTVNLREACLSLFISSGEGNKLHNEKSSVISVNLIHNPDHLASASREKLPKRGKRPGMTKNSEKTVIDLQQPEAKGEQDLSYADLTVDSPYWTDDTTAPGKASAFGQSDRVVPLIASTSNSKDTAVQDREGLPRSGVHIRWSKHVLALAVLALILAITLAYAHTGFILLLFIGLPLAIYSCWNDYNVQMGALRSSLKQAPRGSYGSLTLVENDETKKPELKSDEQLSGFLQAVRENHKLQKRLKVASNFDEVVSIAKQAGFGFSKADLEARAQQTPELRDAELEAVAGGYLAAGWRAAAISRLEIGTCTKDKTCR
jgi:predicted ribosomally synthesized peptide with nif11-like leader